MVNKQKTKVKDYVIVIKTDSKYSQIGDVGIILILEPKYYWVSWINIDLRTRLRTDITNSNNASWVKTKNLNIIRF